MAHSSSGAQFAAKKLSSSLFEEAKAAVREFSGSAAVDAAAATAFGVSGAAVAAAVQGFDDSGWPRLVLVGEGLLHGAHAAYDASRDTIYLSRTFLLHATAADVMAV